MQNLILFILIIFLGCSKQDKTSNQSADSVKSSGSTTAGDVKQTSQTTSQPVKTYKKGEAIELYDLIYMLLPDENSNVEYGKWDEIKNIPQIKWTDSHGNNESGVENGDVKLTIGSKNFNSDWGISIHREQNIYIHFVVSFSSLAVDFPEELAKGVTLEYLLSKHNHDIKTIGSNLYEVKLPNKKTCWIYISDDSGNKIGTLLVEIYLDKKDTEIYK